MRVYIERIFLAVVAVLDVMMSPLVYLSALLMKFVRVAGVENLPRSKSALMRVGVFPVRDHYYEPAFHNAPIRELLSKDRDLPGIDWNTAGQLKLLNSFSYGHELQDVPLKQVNGDEFYMENLTFESGDAEYWYSMIRHAKPRRIVEIGSGFSTRMARRALAANRRTDPAYECEHILIEPYENEWLEQIDGVTVIREKVEDCDVSIFKDLAANDILFIDSSHIIRPHGDVVFEYLQLLPQINDGVIVHIHDIFSPKNYPAPWVVDQVKFWNEQYLLEAFLTSNSDWKVIGALNFLKHHHYDDLKATCLFLSEDREPGSFYIQRTG
ncbi:class I SAM-dependent methyltransferase [Mycolicibacterium aichiense]|uniref:class I SAM-dependent methyltransferase n=1 Tax=Mycolicibacterium aichiense TaxID=1799 RepID=UPI003D677944